MLDNRTTETRAPGTYRSIASMVGRRVVEGKSVSLDSTTPIRTERVDSRSGGASATECSTGKANAQAMPMSPKTPVSKESLLGTFKPLVLRIVQSSLHAGDVRLDVDTRIGTLCEA